MIDLNIHIYFAGNQRAGEQTGVPTEAAEWGGDLAVEGDVPQEPSLVMDTHHGSEVTYI